MDNYPSGFPGKRLTPAIVKRKTANQTVTDTTTFANDTEIFFSVVSGRRYVIRGTLFVTTVSTSGVKIDFNNSTATASACKIGATFKGAAFYVAYTSFLATPVNGTAEYTAVEIDGTIVINAGGKLGMRFGQVSETGAAESVIMLAGSYLELAEF